MVDFPKSAEGAARLARACVTFHRLTSEQREQVLDAPSSRRDYRLVQITQPTMLRDGTIGFLALWEQPNDDAERPSLHDEDPVT